MKVRYFADTDTMLIEFRDAPVAETLKVVPHERFLRYLHPAPYQCY